MRIYFATTITSLNALTGCELISAGFVAEDGREWYAECTDFRYSGCSPEAFDKVLPLLGQVAAEHVTTAEFAGALGRWLKTFDSDIDLITDQGAHWFLLNDYTRYRFKSLSHTVVGHIWVWPQEPKPRTELAQQEARFWDTAPAMRGHALYEARCLRELASGRN